jgi:hypothetical protein
MAEFDNRKRESRQLQCRLGPLRRAPIGISAAALLPVLAVVALFAGLTGEARASCGDYVVLGRVAQRALVLRQLAERQGSLRNATLADLVRLNRRDRLASMPDDGSHVPCPACRRAPLDPIPPAPNVRSEDTEPQACFVGQPADAAANSRLAAGEANQRPVEGHPASIDHPPKFS